MESFTGIIITYKYAFIVSVLPASSVDCIEPDTVALFDPFWVNVLVIKEYPVAGVIVIALPDVFCIACIYFTGVYVELLFLVITGML